ncbi:MAG: NUDIX domain-containing protein [Maribacter sp.]|uniref:NUDIX hydrolase n=1 Tax=Maribacter sp. TaxID=1897614 RepID=UPI0032982E38
MDYKGQQLVQLLHKAQDLFLPHISIDTVIFGYEQRQLKVLVLQLTDNKWMLPGGYIGIQESLDEAACRILKERIGLEDVCLKQFYTFGSPERSFAKELPALFKELGAALPEDHWIMQRFISTGYYALVHIPDSMPTPGLFAKGFKWATVSELPRLLFDHEHIVQVAVKNLQEIIKVNPIAFHLLPTKFTMPELHRLFESILERKMDRSRFQKKMFSYQVFERLQERREGGAHRRPYLYSYRKEV